MSSESSRSSWESPCCRAVSRLRVHGWPLRCDTAARRRTAAPCSRRPRWRASPPSGRHLDASQRQLGFLASTPSRTAPSSPARRTVYTCLIVASDSADRWHQALNVRREASNIGRLNLGPTTTPAWARRTPAWATRNERSGSRRAEMTQLSKENRMASKVATQVRRGPPIRRGLGGSR